ncbi:MAG: acetolactate synthase small subunit [Gammaproteobacteria bacterium]|nr:acetolactate synthase small subunit [Gammaproteobacteria bacterium]|tara:strand:+ start:104 stop:577 length:474 start_codon:yes stop_codon:yes gene_type:complete
MRHIISVLLENESGALSRVANLFSARNYNIESLSVAPSEDSSSSRMTIVTSGNDDVIEQIIKQLDKLIDVINVTDITSEDHLEREIVLISLKSKDFNKSKLKENDNIKIHEIDNNNVILELVDSPKNINKILNEFDNLASSVVRSGAVGINKTKQGE